jgi:putative DNA primase/helicase
MSAAPDLHLVELNQLDGVDEALMALDIEKTAGDDLTILSPSRPYRLYAAADLDELAPAEWIVENALPRNAIIALIGAKGTYKTFAALDLACHIASGKTWNGRRVKSGNVVYVYAEGPFGARARVDAWCAFNAYASGLPFNRGELSLWLLPARIGINDPVAVAALLVEIERLPAKPVLVVIDTLNINLDGDEDGKGMGGFTTGCIMLRDKINGSVLVVHHTPLGAEDRGRGHTSFDGAVDTRFIISRDADRAVIECTHQRNGSDGWSVAFDVIPIAGSLAIKPSALDGGELKGQRREMLELLHAQGTLSYSAWLAGTELKPSSFRKARTWLLAKAYVRQDAKKYTATDAGVLALGHQGHSGGHRD